MTHGKRRLYQGHDQVEHQGDGKGQKGKDKQLPSTDMTARATAMLLVDLNSTRLICHSLKAGGSNVYLAPDVLDV